MASLDPRVVAGCRAASLKYKVPLATVIGIVQQESAGKFFAIVHGEERPVVRWEGHYFEKRLTSPQLMLAHAARLASPKVGGIGNPASQEARWDKLIQPAMRINRQAAIESVSWGLGQVMGSHWKRLEFESADAFLTYVSQGIVEQIDVMMRYCQEFGLIDDMQRGDIEGFVRGYNGPGAVASYSASIRKLIVAAARDYKSDGGSIDGVPVNNVADAKAKSTMLRSGVKGPRVREAQELLHRAGHAVEVDGDFGPATKRAVEAFQKKNNLTADGIIGPATMRVLETYKVDPTEDIASVGAAEAVTKTPEGRQGAATAGLGLGLTTAVQPALDAIQPLTGSGGWIDTVYVGLTGFGVLVTLGGMAWVGYGWWKANSNVGLKVLK